MKAHAKALLVGQKAGDGGTKVYTFRATSEAIDRQGEIVTLDGWELDNYESNPVILDSHNYFGIEAIVGRALPPLRMTESGVECDVVFNSTPKGRLAEQLVEEGNLRAVSVGFRSLERARGTEPGSPMKHTRKELLEISVVPVPANAEALRVRGYEPETLSAAVDAITAEVKAGRVLSKKNEGLLRQAADAINGVLAALGEPANEDEGKGAGDPPGDTGKAADLDVSSIAAFLNRKEG